MVSEATVDGLDGNGLLKAYAFSMKDKMAVGALGALGTMGEMAPLTSSPYGILPNKRE